MKPFATLSLLLVLPLSLLFAQAPINYDDVGLIINVNDTNSVAIGEYFARVRNIPPRNVIWIQAPAKETITPEEFDAMRAQIEEYLTVTTGLVDTLNFFVTTKGVPLRVLHSGGGGDPTNASVDAELMLILGAFAPHIHQNTLFASSTSINTQPYFNTNMPYRRKNVIPSSNPPQTFDLFLTTRLTGLTKEDVFRLIDRSGPHTLVNKDSALWVFDRDPIPIQLNPYDNNLGLAGQYLASKGWRALVNSDSVFVTDQRNVLGYASWGSNDHYDHLFSTKARPRNSWLPGSVAETYVSTSARNFTPGAESGQSRIADLIEEGCTGASGYVFEPYTVALTWVNWLVDRYTSGYTLAESYYMCNPTISWMAVIVGDPKTTIVSGIPDVPRPVADAPATACLGSNMQMHADSLLPGNQFWFEGDSATVLAAGLPLNTRHPLWIATGPNAWVKAEELGTKRFTFVNENFVGRGLCELRVDVVAAPEVTVTLSADTVYLSDGGTVSFSAVAEGAVSWEWEFGDGATSDEQAPTHQYTQTGRFLVKVTVSNGTCEAEEQRMVTVRQLNGANELPSLATVPRIDAVYPNPVAGAAMIRFSLPARMPVRLRVYDALGRTVEDIANDIYTAGAHSLLWRPGQLPAGAYLCVLEAGGTRVTRRISILR